MDRPHEQDQLLDKHCRLDLPWPLASLPSDWVVSHRPDLQYPVLAIGSLAETEGGSRLARRRGLAGCVHADYEDQWVGREVSVRPGLEIFVDFLLKIEVRVSSG